MHPLQERRALVCGSSQGIGRACAGELARLGASVTLVARDSSALKVVLRELDVDAGQRHTHFCADFADPPALSAGVTAHLAEYGPLHVLVNNTGGPPSGALLEADPEHLAGAFSNHVVCFQLLTKLLVPGMRECGFGRIVNIISVSVIQPIQGLGVSNTIRGAVANWGRTMAGELAPSGITVNNILPGYTDTARLHSLFEKRAARTGAAVEEVERIVVESIPAKRLADPKEIAAVVGFLCSPAASYVTGVNLPVDGGRTAVQ